METDLYGPISRFFLDNGYIVRSEVHRCDIVALKGDELVVVELKMAFNMDLVLQAVDRQRVADLVYVAVPRPKTTRSRRWQRVIHLVRRLELGLILVNLTALPSLEFVCHPQPFDRGRSQQTSLKRRRAIVQETVERSGEYNVGGMSQRPIVTAYRENCLQIAWHLHNHGPLSPAALRHMGTCAKTQRMLYDNHYGWFVRVSRGLYSLTESGDQALREYADLTARFQATGGSDQGNENVTR